MSKGNESLGAAFSGFTTHYPHFFFFRAPHLLFMRATYFVQFSNRAAFVAAAGGDESPGRLRDKIELPVRGRFLGVVVGDVNVRSPNLAPIALV